VRIGVRKALAVDNGFVVETKQGGADLGFESFR
jgi:hypothetical protein